VYVVTVREYVALPFDTGKSSHSWLGCATAWGIQQWVTNPNSAEVFSSPDKAG